MENIVRYKAWRVGLLRSPDKNYIFMNYQDALEEYNQYAPMFDNVQLIPMEIIEVHEWYQST